MKSQNYRDLLGWQKAMDLVDIIYNETRAFPREEQYGLTSQVRRAAVSVPSNIAEGQGRRSKAEFQQFLSIAHGSLREVETQTIIARRQNFLKPAKEEVILNLCAETGRLIQGLINYLDTATKK